MIFNIISVLFCLVSIVIIHNNNNKFILPVLLTHILYLIYVILTAIKKLPAIDMTSAPLYIHVINMTYIPIIFFIIFVIDVLYRYFKNK